MTRPLLSARAILQILEVAHESTGAGWGTDVSEALTRSGGGAMSGTALMTYRPSEGGLQPLHPLSHSLWELIGIGQAALSSEQAARVYAPQATAVTATSVYGGPPPATFKSALRGLGMADFLGVTAPLGQAGSFSIGTGLMHAHSLGEDARHRLAALALRLRAVWQVRQAFDAGSGLPLASSAPPTARARSAQADRALARAIRVRGDDTAAEAINAWTALLREGWLVVSTGHQGETQRVVLTRNPGHDGVEPFGLTRRERQVVDLVASGLSNKEVGYELNVPETSVATILLRARQKLGVGSRLELVQLKRWLTLTPGLVA
jgi:DNA-binding CsgD family transcriptional regulator